MFLALILILFMQLLTCHIQPTAAKCTANIPNCRVSGSTSLYCKPIVPSVPQFLGMNISECTEFGLQNEWTLSSIPKETFTGFRDIQTIYFNRSGLSYLPCDLFYYLKGDLRTVYLPYNHLETIQNCTFRNLEHLETLDLTNNRVSKLDEFLFYTLPSLQRINMRHNKISDVSPRVFRAVNRSNLEVINLSSNKISVIREGVFTYLKLKKLEISDNGLGHIHRESFLNSRRTIQTLNLRKNVLTDEVWDALEGLIKLETIYLDNNLLTTVRPVVFNHLLNIQYIQLSNNLIQEVKDVRMRSGILHFISLSYNNVSHFETDVFSLTQTFSRWKSVTIDLSFNNLQTLYLSLPPCNETCYIKLQNNRLKKLTFSDSTRNQLNTIDVRNNHLVNLADSFPYSKYYYLSNNPLSTETALRFLVQKLKNSFKLYMSNVSMFCSSHYDFPEVNQGNYIFNISSLSSLDLSNNCIKDEFVCSLLYNSTRKISINLDRNYISSVPGCMVTVPNTIRLSLQSNRISDIKFKNISALINNLNLNRNLVTNLDINVTLGKMESINLRSNKLGKVNEISEHVSYDHIVDVSNNGITELKTINFTFLSGYIFIGSLKLNVSSNSLSKLPNIISVFKTDHDHFHVNLKQTFVFSKNNLKNISTIYFNSNQSRTIFHVVFLDFYFDKNNMGFISNPIVFFGTGFYVSGRCRISYNFAFNMFKSYPSCDFLLPTGKYRPRMYPELYIDLSYNKLSRVPDFDDKTACYLLLTKLDLSHNQIQKINHHFNSTSTYSKVNKLFLSHNNLEFIVSYAFNKLRNLQTLDLSVNNLHVITKGLELMGLRYLNLSHNGITYVPSAMSEMKYLNKFDLSHNRIVQFNAEIIMTSDGSLNLKENYLDCSCANAWIRNNVNYEVGDMRCSTPKSLKGYLLKCYPIRHCNEKHFIYSTWEVQSQCYTDNYVDMEMKYFESLDNNITVVWETFGPFSPFGYFLMLKENGTNMFISELLESYTFSFTTKWDHHADQICIQVLKKDIMPHFLKCIDINKFNLPHRSKITKIYNESVTVIILAVLLCLAIMCLVVSVLVIKFHSCICNYLNMRHVIYSTRKETELSNNPVASGNEIASGAGQQDEAYENLSIHGTVSEVYEDIKA